MSDLKPDDASQACGSRISDMSSANTFTATSLAIAAITSERIPLLTLASSCSSEYLSGGLLVPLSQDVGKGEHVGEHHLSNTLVHLVRLASLLLCAEATMLTCDIEFLRLLLLSHRYARGYVNLAGRDESCLSFWCHLRNK